MKPFSEGGGLTCRILLVVRLLFGMDLVEAEEIEERDGGGGGGSSTMRMAGPTSRSWRASF